MSEGILIDFIIELEYFIKTNRNTGYLTNGKPAIRVDKLKQFIEDYKNQHNIVI